MFLHLSLPRCKPAATPLRTLTQTYPNRQPHSKKTLRVGCEYLRGIETAINAGERDLGGIQTASLQFYAGVPRDVRSIHTR